MCLTTGAVGGVDREVFLNMKHGVEAKSYEDVSFVPFICNSVCPLAAL